MAEALPSQVSEPSRSLETHALNYEATRISNGWMGKLGNKVARLAGHVGLTIPAEFFNYIGGALVSGGFAVTAAEMAIRGAGSITALGPLGAAAGLASCAVGTLIGWQGAKHAGGAERTLYTTVKALAPIAPLLIYALGSPALGVVYYGLSAASTLLAMRHRK